jgi:hypothetical protein
VPHHIEDHGDPVTQTPADKWRRESGQHREPNPISEFLHPVQCCSRTKQKDFASESVCCERSQHLGTSLLNTRWPQDNKIDKPCFEHTVDFPAVCALASDDIKLFQSVANESANMLLPVRYADTGCDHSPIEKSKDQRLL